MPSYWGLVWLHFSRVKWNNVTQIYKNCQMISQWLKTFYSLNKAHRVVVVVNGFVKQNIQLGWVFIAAIKSIRKVCQDEALVYFER